MRRTSLVGAAILCSAAAAHADLVTFDNSAGVFNWRPFALQQQPGLYLDVTLPPTQSGSATPLSIGWSRGTQSTSDGGAPHGMSAEASARVVRSTVPVWAPLYNFGNQTVALYPPQDFQAGPSIGLGLNWQQSATLGWYYGLFGGDHWIVGSGFDMGLELIMNDGVHFAFAEFALRNGTYGIQYQPTRWGYETTPNVSVTVPAPAAWLVIGAGWCVAPRRRRSTPAG